MLKAFVHYGINSSDVNCVNKITGSEFGDYLVRTLEDRLHFDRESYYKSDKRVAIDIQKCSRTVLAYRKQAEQLHLCEFDIHEDNRQVINKPNIDAILSFFKKAKSLWLEAVKKLKEKTCSGIRSVMREIKAKLFELGFCYCEMDSQGVRNEFIHKKDSYKKESDGYSNHGSEENHGLIEIIKQQSKKAVNSVKKVFKRDNLSHERSIDPDLVEILEEWTNGNWRSIKNWFCTAGPEWLRYHSYEIQKDPNALKKGAVLRKRVNDFKNYSEEKKNDSIMKAQEERITIKETIKESEETYAPYNPNDFKSLREGAGLL